MGFGIRNLFNNNRIVLDPYGLISPKVKEDLRIAHVSDLHEKRFGDGNGELFEAVASIEPDLIAITGDLVAHEGQKAADLEYTKELADGLAEIAPSFFVAGNHEGRFMTEICDTLTASGIHVVDDELISMEIRGTVVNVSGIHDPAVFGAEKLPERSRIFEGVPGYNIFLVHRPEVFPALARRNIDLVLAGHTHGAQIRIPQLSSLYMIGQGFFPKYMEGEFTTDEMTMIISRGLGASGYPTVRINNPPDLVAIQVLPPQEMTNHAD